jgi:hypothetical protein
MPVTIEKAFANSNNVQSWFYQQKPDSWGLNTSISPKIYPKADFRNKEVGREKEVDVIHLPSSVKKIISDSRQLLELKDDWDGEGSLGYSEGTLNKAIKFLEENAKNYFRSSGLWVTAPEICPGPNGSIDLLWKLENRELLVNIPVDENSLADYYGDDLGINTIKGKLNLTEKHEWILMWLTK